MLCSIRLSVFWILFPWLCYCANANSDHVRTWAKSKTDFRFAGCPFDKLEICFRRAFGSMADPNGAVASCDDYERLSSCFLYVNCSNKETSEIGARIFFGLKKELLPKEFFTALLTRWRLRCSVECADYGLHDCRRSMLAKEQETDLAFLIEMQSLKIRMTEFTEGLSSQRDACSNYRKAMLKWHFFRLDKCSNGDSACYCRVEAKQLRGICNVRCERFHSANSSDALETRIFPYTLTFAFLYLFCNNYCICDKTYDE